MNKAIKTLLTKVFSTPLMQKMLFIMLIMALAAVLWPNSDDKEFNPIEQWIEYGEATFYADYFQGRKTASGQRYYHNLPTAAHRSIPFGTIVKVTCIRTNNYTEVKINDRGPFIGDRIIDLSKSAFEEIADINKGVILVKLEIVENPN